MPCMPWSGVWFMGSMWYSTTDDGDGDGGDGDDDDDEPCAFQEPCRARSTRGMGSKYIKIPCVAERLKGSRVWHVLRIFHEFPILVSIYGKVDVLGGPSWEVPKCQDGGSRDTEAPNGFEKRCRHRCRLNPVRQVIFLGSSTCPRGTKIWETQEMLAANTCKPYICQWSIPAYPLTCSNPM